MGLKNTQKLRDVGRELANFLSIESKDPYTWNLINKWNSAVSEFESLMNKRKAKKNRKQEAKKLAKARGENKG